MENQRMSASNALLRPQPAGTRTSRHLQRCLVPALLGALAVAGAAQSALAHEPASPRASEVPAPTAEYLPYLGFSLTEGWLDPWVHSHYSREGTPFVHLFNLEPAYLDRDFFFVYRYTREPHAIEEELEVELEWAFTRRIGLMVEAELEREREAGETETELGDFTIAPRFLLVEAPRFLLSTNLKLAIPMGQGDEYAFGPSITTWSDLGNWVTLQTELGTRYGLSSGDVELFYGAGLAYTFRAPQLFAMADGEVTPGHYPSGLTTVMAELIGSSEMRGEQGGRHVFEALLGVGYSVTDAVELRAAYQFPVGGRRDIDYSTILSAIYHF